MIELTERIGAEPKVVKTPAEKTTKEDAEHGEDHPETGCEENDEDEKAPQD